MPKITNLGRVTFTFQGTFVPETAYKRLDLVATTDTIYAAIVDVPAGIPITDTNYFRKVFDISTYLDNIQWYARVVGEPFAIMTHLTSTTPPQLDDCKFIKLSYNDSYNSGLLTSQTTSTDGWGRIVATAKINLSTSPLYNKTVSLINTEGRFLRPGDTSGVLGDDDVKPHKHYTLTADRPSSGTSGNVPASNNQVAYGSWRDYEWSYLMAGSSLSATLGLTSENPDSIETMVRNISATYFMRIL